MNTSINKISNTLVASFILLFVPYSLSANAATYYLDPVKGSSSGNGSMASPFGSLQSVLEDNLIESQQWSVPYKSSSTLLDKNSGAPIKPGDTLKLKPGYHGNVEVYRYVNSQYITIDGAGNPAVKLGSFKTIASSKWRLQGVSISPYHKPGYNPASERVGNIVFLDTLGYEGPSSDIDIINNDIFTVDQVTSWSKQNWLDRASSGIAVDAEGIKLINNKVRNIRFGITVSRKNALVRSNRVVNFSGDAIRGLGDNGLYEYNFIANGFKVDGNHDDGFQSFTRNKVPISNVTLRGNQFYYDYNHPNKSLISSFQGIGCFDGFFNNWRIENNLLYINHWHGISLYGANDSVIVNNTLVDAVPNGRLRPWVKINPLKESQGGGHGRNNLVRNNLAWLSVEANSVTIDNNVDPAKHDLNTLFTNVAARDFTLKRNAVAINAGSPTNAPKIDLRGFVRDSTPDIGAYEFGATGTGPTPTPVSPQPNPDSSILAPLFLLLDDEE